MIRVLTRKKRSRDTYQLYYLDPTTKREVSRTSEATTAKDAERAARDWENELNDFRGADGDSWDYFRLRFKDEHLVSISENGGKAYATALDSYELEMDPKSLKQLTASAISEFKGKLLGRKKPVSMNTIANYLTHLRSALNWAASVGMIKACPNISIPQIGTRRVNRGRALTQLEFNKLIGACAERVGEEYAEPWRRFLTLLWLSGLRINEACALSWDSLPVMVEMEAQPYPCLIFLVEGHKNRTDEAIPMAPDFYDWLNETPAAERRGLVAPLLTEKGLPFTPKKVGLKISEIGELAKVETPTGFATAHDLRRSFGQRWAAKVRPLTLKKLMRHSSMETTLKFYLTLSAADAGQDLWQNVPKNVPKVASLRVIGE